MKPPVIQSDRLLLTAVTPDDTDAVYEYCLDPVLQRYTRIPVPYTLGDARYFTTTYAEQADRDEHLCLWAIKAKDAAGTLLGALELRFDSVASAGIGYWLGAPHRGTGIMTEAVGLVADHSFDPRGFDLEKLRWDAVVGNAASATVACRNGFRLLGIIEGHVVIRDVAHDAWVAELGRGDPREPAQGWPL